jgi:hypothetical protein
LKFESSRVRAVGGLIGVRRESSLVGGSPFRYNPDMLDGEADLNFVRHATAELAISFTDQRDHNLHAAFNGLIKAVESDRRRIIALEAEVKALRSHENGQRQA